MSIPESLYPFTSDQDLGKKNAIKLFLKSSASIFIAFCRDRKRGGKTKNVSHQQVTTFSCFYSPETGEKGHQLREGTQKRENQRYGARLHLVLVAAGKKRARTQKGA